MEDTWFGTEPSQFEELLEIAGYTLVDNDHSCSHESHAYTWYVQPSRGCYDSEREDEVFERELAWYKLCGCKDCFVRSTGSYGCGGLYNNFRGFKRRKSGAFLRDYGGLDPQPLEPQKKLQ